MTLNLKKFLPVNTREGMMVVMKSITDNSCLIASLRANIQRARDILHFAIGQVVLSNIMLIVKQET